MDVVFGGEFTMPLKRYKAGHDGRIYALLDIKDDVKQRLLRLRLQHKALNSTIMIIKHYKLPLPRVYTSLKIV